MKNLLCLGMGYTAQALAPHLPRSRWSVVGTRRSVAGGAVTAHWGLIRFDGSRISSELSEAIRQATHLLVSIPPDARGDVILQQADELLTTAEQLSWIGYLSTTGVYGDHGGAWVDESSTCRPTSARSRQRLLAEQQWLAQHRDQGFPVHVFRLAGIYGPGRSVIEKISSGQVPPRIHKEGQVFNRVHVEDIAQTLVASIGDPNPGRVYNVADSEPAPRSDVIEYACKLLGREPGPVIPFGEARDDLSPMARSFWSDSRRVSNRRMREELRVRLRYPSFREGLSAIADQRSATS